MTSRERACFLQGLTASQSMKLPSEHDPEVKALFMRLFELWAVDQVEFVEILFELQPELAVLGNKS